MYHGRRDRRFSSNHGRTVGPDCPRKSYSCRERGAMKPGIFDNFRFRIIRPSNKSSRRFVESLESVSVVASLYRNSRHHTNKRTRAFQLSSANIMMTRARAGGTGACLTAHSKRPSLPFNGPSCALTAAIACLRSSLVVTVWLPVRRAVFQQTYFGFCGKPPVSVVWTA